MALYSTITKPKFNALVAKYDKGSSEAKAAKTADALLFPPKSIPYAKDSVGGSITLPSGLNLLEETASVHVSVSSGGGQKVYLLGPGNVGLLDQAGVSDNGDVIIGGKGHDSISASSGFDSIFTGFKASSVSLLSNGNTSVSAGGRLFVDFGGTKGNDTVKGGFNKVDIDVTGGEKAKSTHSHAGVTTVHFTDGQTLVYSGSNVHVKL